MDEFALCWNNFQDNIATGFQNLYERGDLVDVTLACDGKLLQAHKIVLAICSPYFQEMFTSNPCKHPIIILKDVTSTVMSELLQFMYQGEVNVKHTELTAFMKIAETLQIKGLTTSQKSLHQGNLNTLKSPSGPNDSNQQDNQDPQQQSNNSLESKIISSGCTTPKSDNITGSGASTSQKRTIELSSNDSFTIYPRKARRIILDGNHDHDLHSESMDMHSEEVFLPPIPHISMIESRFDLNNVKRENIEPLNSPNMRNVLPAPFNFEYNNSLYVKGSNNSNIEYPNDLHMASDFSKGVNHMDIPAVTPGEKWFQGKLEFMLSQRGKPLLVHDGYNFGIQYIRKDKKYWQCNLSRKYNCKARVTTTDAGDILVTNNEHCHTEIRQHLRKDYRNKINNWQMKSETI